MVTVYLNNSKRFTLILTDARGLLRSILYGYLWPWTLVTFPNKEICKNYVYPCPYTKPVYHRPSIKTHIFHHRVRFISLKAINHLPILIPTITTQHSLLQLTVFHQVQTTALPLVARVFKPHIQLRIIRRETGEVLMVQHLILTSSRLIELHKLLIIVKYVCLWYWLGLPVWWRFFSHFGVHISSWFLSAASTIAK